MEPCEPTPADRQDLINATTAQQRANAATVESKWREEDPEGYDACKRNLRALLEKAGL